jgi:NADP-dependent 3-hydroxy acid dehydrogenase YdfG
VQNLKGKIAWITGAGSGIGRAAAIALAQEGATVVLTGRRKQPLHEVARTVKANGGNALVQTGDLTRATTASRVAKAIQTKLGRIDILVNNAGVNILKRSWQELQPDGADEVMEGNLSSAFYCVLAVLPIMRAQRGGLLIHTASWAGRFVAPLAGAAYVAAKHGVVAMSHSINHEECVNGIRSSVVCPGEVATPILDQRPVPVSKEDRARMLQPEDMGDLIRYIATLPVHVCLNEVLVSPTWNRGYVGALRRV